MGREWGKRRREFSYLLFCWRGTVAEQGSAWSASVFYKYVVGLGRVAAKYDRRPAEVYILILDIVHHALAVDLLG